MANVSRTRGAAQPSPTDRRRQDIIGLLIFFAGAAGLLSLAWTQPGFLPDKVSDLLRIFAGIGSYAVPVLLMAIGTMFLLGYERLTFTHASYGTLIMFLVFVSVRHLAVHPFGTPIDKTSVMAGGGFLGAAIGKSLDMLCGRVIGELFLTILTLIGVVLLVDQPLMVIFQRVHARGKAGAQAAQRGFARSAQAGAALLPGTRDEEALEAETPIIKGPKPSAATFSLGSDRDARAAQIANRAINGETDATEEGEHSRTARNASTLFGFFNRTRSDKGDAEAPQEERPTVAEVPAPMDDAPFDAEPIAPKPRTRSAKITPAPSLTDTDTEIVLSTPSCDATDMPLEPPFVLPPLNLLKESPPSVSRRSPAELTDRIRTIEQTLEQFNIGANVVEVASGPSVTRFEIQLAPGIKVNKIVSLADNLAMSLAAIDVRVEAPIPGKSAIGLEVPNANPVTVSLRECLDTDEFRNAPSKLTIALGKDVAGQYRYADLTRMPHLLIGGSTNSGKSVCLNAIIASLLYRATPREVKMLMIDPKRVELSLWDGIPHLMHPVVKDVKQAAGIFRAALKEMDNRYNLFVALGTRNIEGYNQKVPEGSRLPYIVLIVDELADLMMQQGPEIETSICRLAQLARATGIHLVIATQRPSVDIITGTIKANISSRIAFAVASQVDSRTILDMTGADRLVGRGDMLFMPIDASKPQRIQGCYLGETETNALVEYLKEQERPEFTISLSEGSGDAGSMGAGASDDVDDQFFEQAVRLVVNNGQASTSMLQRRFRIGYTRAARIVEMMEERGIVGPLNGAKPREICITRDEVERMFNPGGTLPSVADYEDEGDE